jgi:hypothetical protein
MHYNGPVTCWCGCQSELVLAVEGSETPVFREALYFLCPSSGEPLGFSARGKWMSTVPEGGSVHVQVSRERSPSHI